jgi:hypothetical protein
MVMGPGGLMMFSKSGRCFWTGSSSRTFPSSTSFMTETATMVVVMSPTWLWSVNCTGSLFSRVRTPSAEDHSPTRDFTWMMTAVAPPARIFALYSSSTDAKAGVLGVDAVDVGAADSVVGNGWSGGSGAPVQPASEATSAAAARPAARRDELEP